MKKIIITKYYNGTFALADDNIINEARLSIQLSSIEIAGLMTLPVAIDKLAVGYLFSECYFNHPDELQQINTNPVDAIVNIKMHPENFKDSDFNNRSITISSSKGIIRKEKPDSINYPVVNSKITHTAQTILLAANTLNTKSTLFRATGGVHSSGLWQNDDFLWFYDDIGRHNAIDKVIGHALLEKWPIPDDSILVSSGRISSDIICKTIRAGIPVLVSRSAPTGSAIQLAEDYGITMVGFARGDKFNIYTYPDRIKLS